VGIRSIEAADVIGVVERDVSMALLLTCVFSMAQVTRHIDQAKTFH
jgi:hypothetical protein